jgi:hypothetical protein
MLTLLKRPEEFVFGWSWPGSRNEEGLRRNQHVDGASSQVNVQSKYRSQHKHPLFDAQQGYRGVLVQPKELSRPLDLVIFECPVVSNCPPSF